MSHIRIAPADGPNEQYDPSFRVTGAKVAGPRELEEAKQRILGEINAAGDCSSCKKVEVGERIAMEILARGRVPTRVFDDIPQIPNGVTFFEALNYTQPHSHGALVFGLLAEHNPDSQFVFASEPTTSIEELCNLNSRTVLAQVKLRYANASVVLKEIMERHEISMINTSHGWSEELVYEQSRMYCKRSPNRRAIAEFLEIQTSFVETLAANSEVLLVRALPNVPSRPLDAKRDEAVCLDRPNIVRVAFTNFKNLPIPVQGAWIDPSVVPPVQHPVLPCADVVINSGFDEIPGEDPRGESDYGPSGLQLFSPTGFGRSKMTAMGNSWGAPVALSLLNFLRFSALERGGLLLSPAALKALVKNRIMDPLKHGQTELAVGEALAAKEVR